MVAVCPWSAVGTQIKKVTLFCQRLIQPIITAPSRSQTHPDLPKGKEQVTLHLDFSQSHQPPPSLPRRGGTDTLITDNPLIIKQSSVTVPPLRGRLGGG